MGCWRKRRTCTSPSSSAAKPDGRPPPSPAAAVPPAPPQPTLPPGAEEEEEAEERRNGKGRIHSALTSPSSGASPTINLTQEYALAVQTSSYNEIWSKIHPGTAVSSHHLIAEMLQPDRASVEEVLRDAHPTRLVRLVSRYMDSSERTSHLFLSLRRSVDAAHALYAPITDLLDLLPVLATPASSPAHHLSPSQCDWAFDIFLQFHHLDNPFPAPSSVGQNDDGFGGMRSCFAELRQQLDARLLLAHREHRLLRRATCGAATCLIGSVAGLAMAALVIATHALATLVAGPAVFSCLPPRDPLEGRRRRLRERMAQLDAAARGAYVLHNDLDTIERLVARLYATVESDRGLVRLVLERGKGHRHPIEEVVRQLRKNHPALIHQLRDLDEHVCLCFATVNRARSLLLQHLHRRRHG